MVPRLVSVIIPTRNRPNYLQQAVESVLCQTYPNIEVIIIDDGSDSKGAATKKILRPYLPLPNLTYTYQHNRGVGAAVNRGLMLSQGEYIQRLDDDDRLLPEKVARTVDAFQARPEVGLVATGYHHIDATGKRTHTCSPHPCPEPARLLNMLMRCISACAGVMVRSLVHQKVGAYRNIKAQDYEMWIRIAKEFEIETINLPLAEYRQHPGNSIKVKSNRVKMERTILDFTREQIEATPLDTLIPNLQSEPHAYALRAAVYLQQDGEYARGVLFAKAELKKGLQLAPTDPLLLLWERVLSVHEGGCFPQNACLPLPYREQAQALTRFGAERKRLMAQGISPSSLEVVHLRQRFSRFCSALIQQTFKTAVGKNEEVRMG